MASTSTTCAPERAAELAESLNGVRARVTAASKDRSPTLVAVSKLKPASDVLGCYQHGQRDFGENYVQELCDKAPVLPEDIRWHFIGTLQSNKAKTLACPFVLSLDRVEDELDALEAIPNLYAVHTLNSTKAATALNKGVPDTRADPLNVLIQVNTSGEDSKSGLPPLTTTSSSELVDLARHVVTDCPKLHLLGLMTIGSLDASLNEGDENKDFETLTRTRDLLEEALRADGQGRWGEDGKLLLSMGMSSDFEAAIHAGSAIVRVGTSIFGSRK